MASQFQLQTGNMKNWVNTSSALLKLFVYSINNILVEFVMLLLVEK
jgi:hypothetical protein